MTVDGRSQPSSSGRTKPRIGCATAQRTRVFQIIPIKMKRAISIRKAALMIATIRTASAADRGHVMPPILGSPQAKLSEIGNISVPNADGARCERRRAPRIIAALATTKGDTDRKTKQQQRVLPEPCRISNQFPASFVELNACSQTHDIFANEPMVNHLPSRFTLRRHALVPEKAAVWRYEHPHVYER
jgi:hypothetical protein